MSDAEYRLLIQRSFDEELSKQEHRALINHLETSSSGQKFHHQLDQMIQAAQDTPLPDELRPQNPESLARQIMEQLPQKKSSIFGFLAGLFGGGKTKSSSASSTARGKGESKGDAKKDKALAALGKGDKAIPVRKIGKKEKAAEVRADEIESQVGTFSRLKSIGTRADIVDGRDAQSTTRSLGEKFLGMPGQGNLMDEAPLTLAESIKRKVSESQKLSPLDDEDDDASGSQDYSSGGRPPSFASSDNFARPAAAQSEDDNWSQAPLSVPSKPPVKLSPMGGVQPAVTAQGLDWSGSPAPSPGDEHPGSSIGLSAPIMNSPGSAIGLAPAAPAAPGAGSAIGLVAGAKGPASSSWGGMPTKAEPNPAAPAAAAPAADGWGSGWGDEGLKAGAPLKSSDSWAKPGSDVNAAWGQEASPQPQSAGQDPWGSAVAASGTPTNAAGISPAAPSAPANPQGAETGTNGGGGAWSGNSGWAAQGPTSSGTGWGSVESLKPASSEDPWGGAAVSATPAAAAPAAAAPAADGWSNASSWSNDAQAAPAAPAAAVPSDPWSAPSGGGAAPWGAAPTVEATPAAAAPADAWSAPAAAPSAPVNDPWNAAPAAAPTMEPADPWSSPASATPAPAATPADPWSAAPAAPSPAPSAVVPADPWSAAPTAPASTAAPAQVSDPWAAAVNPAVPPTPVASAPAAAVTDPWSAAVSPAAAPATAMTDPWAAAVSPAAAVTDPWAAAVAPQPIAPIQPPEAAGWGTQAKKVSWSPEAEQMQTGNWRAFTKAGGDALATNAPTPAPAPQAAPTEERWDIPIQERMKMQAQQPPAPAPAPVAPVAPAAPAQPADNAARWDVPIQERGKPQEAAPATPVQSSGIPVNQIVEKMGQVLGGTQAAASSTGDSRWDVPIQERSKTGETPQPAAPQAPAPAAQGWGDMTPQAPAPAAQGWGDMTPQAPAPAAQGWGDMTPQASAPAQAAQPAQPAPGWGDAQPAAAGWAAPAAPATGWGIEPPGAAGGWGQSSPAPAPAQQDGWGAPPAWGQPAPNMPQPAPVEAPKPEVTDKAGKGGMFNLSDSAVDKLFADNLGVNEPVSHGLVNTGAPEAANFAPAAAAPAPIPAPAPAAAAEQSKGLFSLNDSQMDQLFSANLGITEPAVPVGQQPAPAPAPAPNNFAPAAPAPAPGGWGQTAPSAPPAAPSGWGPPPAPAAPAAPSGWGAPAPAPAAPSGWGEPPAAPAQPAAPSGWGTTSAPPAPGWSQPQPTQAPAASTAKGGLFSVDDNDVNRIFSENLGVQDQVRSTEESKLTTDITAGANPPPKIAGIGRLDSSADTSQDTGSGRIAAIGKFLLDQKDLDKIGKLTNSDFNDGKMRVLTMEASQDLQSLLGQIGNQAGVIGSVIVGHDGLLIANTMPGDMDAESVGVWALGVYMNTEHVTKKLGHDRVFQVVSRTPRGYVIIADFGGGLLVTVTEGSNTDNLIPLMRTITTLVN